MANSQKQSDLIVSVPEVGDICVEFKWFRINGRDEINAITISMQNSTKVFEPVLLRKIPWAEIINAQRIERAAHSFQKRQTQARAVGPDSTRTLSDQDLEHVAELYLEAWQRDLPVQRHVATALNIAVSTAARRISLARSRGFISRDINPPTNKKAR
jgi:hypothetical protein